MHIEATRRLFSVDEYHRMAEVGVLAPEDRIELVGGEIFRMSAMGRLHIACLLRATRMLSDAFRGKAIVSPQIPLRLTDDTEPEPDLALLRWREDYYASMPPTGDDALLVLEVSETSLRYDRDVKLPRYAAAGVPEVWIIDVTAGALHLYRGPSGARYGSRVGLGRDDAVSVLAFPDILLNVADLLG